MAHPWIRVGDSDKTPLHSAADYRDLEMVQILLDYGVDVNTQTHFGSTPLDFALRYHLNDPRAVRLLLDQREEMINLLSEHRAK
jgi:ankyrin repeat protein